MRLLRALELFRPYGAQVTLHHVMAFLCVAENEGVSVQDVTLRGGFSQSTASRSLRGCGPPTSGWAKPPALGLVEPFLCPSDERRHVIYLTPAGRRLRERLAEALGPAAVRRAPDAARRQGSRDAD